MNSDAERAARLAAIRAVLEVAAGKTVDAEAIRRIAREAVAEIARSNAWTGRRHLRGVPEEGDRGDR